MRVVLQSRAQTCQEHWLCSGVCCHTLLVRICEYDWRTDGRRFVARCCPRIMYLPRHTRDVAYSSYECPTTNGLFYLFLWKIGCFEDSHQVGRDLNVYKDTRETTRLFYFRL